MLSIFIIFLIFLRGSINIEIRVDFGATAMLPCESNNLANISFAKWYRGPELLSAEDDLKTSSPIFNVYRQYNLEIEKIQPEDAGEYSCVLKYKQLEQRIAYKLEIFDPSDKVVNEKHHSSYFYSRIKAAINETVILPCEVIHFASSYGIEWEKDGELILRKTQMSDMNFKYSTMKTLEGFTLEIQNVQPENNYADYICEMANGAKITYQLEILGYSINEKSSCSPSPCGLNSECQAKLEYPVCACRKNYKGKPPNCTPDCKKNCTPYLTCLSEKCRKVCESSCGLNAECVIQDYKHVCACPDNYFGNPYDECDTPPHPITPGNEAVGYTYEVSTNSNIILPCESDEIDDLYHFVEWEITPFNTSFRYKVDLHESRMQLYTQYNLFIARAKPRDEGYYTCKILKDNPEYNITYKLEIVGTSKNEIAATEPTLMPYFRTIRANVDDTVILPCEGVNLNFKHMQWEADAPKNPDLNLAISNFGLNFPNSRVKIFRGYNLEIQNVQAEDAGTYSCLISDSFEKEKLSVISHQLKIIDSSSDKELDPCEKFPCGINSECYPNQTEPVCSCRINYTGKSPFCRKDCVHDVDCFSIACVSARCKDLCKQSCGSNSTCRVQNYIYICMNVDGHPDSPDNSGSDDCGGIPCSVISICGPIAFLLLVIGTMTLLIITKRKERENQRSNQNDVKAYGEENPAFSILQRYATNPVQNDNGRREPRNQQLTVNDDTEEGQSVRDIKIQASESPGHDGIAIIDEKISKEDATGVRVAPMKPPRV